MTGSGPTWRNAALAAIVALTLAGCGQSRVFYAPPEARVPALLEWLGFRSQGSLVLGGPDDLGLGAPPRRLSEVEPTITEKPPAPAVSRLRRDQLVQAAQAWGAQLGYDRSAWEVERALERHSSGLSAVYDFHRVVSPGPRQVGYVIPPVVERSFAAFEGDGREAAAADEYLVLRAPGRIRPVMPTWRDWLLMHRPEPRRPPVSALPTTPEETALFRREFREGWRAGERQAMDELRERLRRLGRDFGGMLEYRRLVALGMMRQIVLSDADFGVTAGERSMRIGARTVRIESGATFRPEPETWRPALAPVAGSEPDPDAAAATVPDMDPPSIAPRAGLPIRTGPQSDGAGALVPDMGPPGASLIAQSDEVPGGHAPQGDAAGVLLSVAPPRPRTVERLR